MQWMGWADVTSPVHASQWAGAIMEFQRHQKTRRVLIIDDNVDAASLLSMVVSAYGHDTEVANSGRVGLQIAQAFHPDIVFLDLGMPGMNGYDVAVALRQLPSLHDVYIAAVTGWNDASTRAQVISAGFDLHLTKPAAVESILDVLVHH
jgi:CheY-like chemotaxis protein